MASQAILEVSGLSVDYATRKGRVRAVRDVSLRIGQRETFGVVGESGSGKSTLAFALMGYLAANARVTSGRIEYRGDDLLAMSRRSLDRLRGAKIAMVYQDPMSSLNPSIRVGGQIAEVLLAHEGVSAREAQDGVRRLLEAVNMPEPSAIARRYPHQISGGQQQRVLIAMALACNPDLLVMDEPTTGLDVTTEAQILDLIEALKTRFSSAILYISHNLGVIARVSDRVGVMYAGEMVEQGPVRQVFRRQLHPYTAALMQCLPGLDFGRRSRALSVIGGRIPDLTDLPDACAFAPRCAHAAEHCRAERPALIAVTPEHASRCFFWEEQERTRATSRQAPAPAAAATPRAASSGPLLEVEHLTKAYRDAHTILGLFGRATVVRALEDVSLALNPNETLAVVGESGCGKTTLARCIVGLVEPTSGRVEFAGREVARTVAARSPELRRRLQMVFQNPDSTLNPRRTIAETLMRPLALFRGMPRRAARAAAGELLRAVRLDEHYLDRLPDELSGGEKQRVGIARAFATDPDLIVCDEPVSALDVSVQAAILNLLGELQARRATAYLFITHDLSVVRYLADRVAVVYLGRICETGAAEQVFLPPHHPYTEALLSAVPVPDPEATLQPIRLAGAVPSAANPPRGCVFHTRCPRKIGPICEDEVPPVQTGGSGHTIVCHIPLATLVGLQSESATHG
ncbi:MAG: ABC transporter ATP-binding protein [Candidatus Rokubacteria bacterium]|nr:ABC transporter ATP-binding protein [Candidatus Rokubacteria bacterium]